MSLIFRIYIYIDRRAPHSSRVPFFDRLSHALFAPSVYTQSPPPTSLGFFFSFFFFALSDALVPVVFWCRACCRARRSMGSRWPWATASPLGARALQVSCRLQARSVASEDDNNNNNHHHHKTSCYHRMNPAKVVRGPRPHVAQRRSCIVGRQRSFCSLFQRTHLPDRGRSARRDGNRLMCPFFAPSITDAAVFIS